MSAATMSQMTCSHPTLSRVFGACPLCPAPSPRKVMEALNPSLELRLLRATKCRKRLSNFVKYGWHVIHPTEELEWNWHLDVICDHVQEVLEQFLRARKYKGKRHQRVRNVLFNVPPRSLKTEIVEVFAPLWVWLFDPSVKTRCVSGNSRVTNKASRMARDIVASDWFQSHFFPDWQIRDDQDAVSLFTNTARGERWATTMGASVTGEGTDIIVVDDPHDAQEAHSELKREGVILKWQEALRNRVNGPVHVRIGIMQRLREDDWSGHVIERGGWEHVVIQEEYEPTKPCKCRSCSRGKTFMGWTDPRTEAGQLMHPERRDAEWVATEKVELGSTGWAGQHQQRPAPAEGAMFKKAWWKYYDPSNAPSFDQTIISVDCSAKKTSDGSATAMLVVSRTKQYRYVRECLVKHIGTVETVRDIRELIKQYPKTSRVLIENKAAGPSVVEMLTAELGDSGIVVEGIEVGSDSKESRAAACCPTVEAGNVMLPRGAPWLDAFLHELCTFPFGANDDQVDAFSQALNWMRGSVDYARALAALSR